MEIQMISVKREEINTQNYRNTENTSPKNFSGRKRNVQKARMYRKNRTIVLTMLAMILGIGFACSVLITNAMATGVDENVKTYKYYSRVYVESGDTLWQIAEEYTDGSVCEIQNCIQEIRTINNMNALETLKSGSYITVPYYSAEFIDV